MSSPLPYALAGDNTEGPLSAQGERWRCVHNGLPPPGVGGVCPSPQTSQSPSRVLSLKNRALRPWLLLKPWQLGSVSRKPAEAAVPVAGCWLLATLGHGCGHVVGREGTQGFPTRSLAHDKSHSPGLVVPCPSMALDWSRVEPLGHSRVSLSGPQQHSGLGGDIALIPGTCSPPI